MERGTLIAVAVAALALSHGGPAQAEGPVVAPSPPPSIAVEGRATLDLVPDVAKLTLGVSLNRPTAAAATEDVAKAAQAIVAGIKAEGIADKDASTGSVSLSAVEPEEGHGQQPARRGSFQASTLLTVTVRPADRAGLIASHLVDMGANTIEGIDFLSSREADVQDDLRAKAVQDARHKAETYVAALGLHLGRVLGIVPVDAGSQFAPAPYRMAVARPAPPPRAVLPTRPDALTVSAGVTIRWEIVP